MVDNLQCVIKYQNINFLLIFINIDSFNFKQSLIKLLLQYEVR